jgi:hypothetical protein
VYGRKLSRRVLARVLVSPQDQSSGPIVTLSHVQEAHGSTIEGGGPGTKSGYPTLSTQQSEPHKDLRFLGSETASRSQLDPLRRGQMYDCHHKRVSLPPPERCILTTLNSSRMRGSMQRTCQADGDSLEVPDLRDPLVAEENFACVTLYLARQDPMEEDPRALSEQVGRLFPSPVDAPHLRRQKTIETSARLSLGGC